MKQYIYSILFFIVTTISFSQKKEIVLNTVYKTGSNSTLNLDLTNVGVIFEESPDNNIYFNYEIIFSRYSKGRRENVVNQSKIKISQEKNLINFKMRNSSFLGFGYHFTFDEETNSMSSLIKNLEYETKIISKKQKTKNQILNEIKLSQESILNNYRKRNYEQYIKTKSFKMKKQIIQNFIIKVPKHVKIRLKANECNISINYKLTSSFVMNSFKGVFKFNEISGVNSRIISSKGIFEANNLQNTRLELIDMYKVKIGEVFNTNLISETSKIQIGEIGKNVSIKDFSSKLYLYNFNKDFTKFNLTGDYTELNLYKVKETNFSMEIFGKNTVLNMNNTKTTFGRSTEQEMTKILQKKRKENILFLGNIKAELKNGVINIK